VIRVANPSDYGAVSVHLYDCWLETYSPRYGSSTVAKMKTALLNDRLDSFIASDVCLAIAKDQASIIGSAFGAVRHATLYIWGCYVREAFQLQGVGTGLINKLVNNLPPYQYMEISVLEDSQSAVSFYEKLGFRLVDNENFELVPNLLVKASKMRAAEISG
jgi:ribosomal protein S18 acetylase RimI-like enzyme